MKELDTLWAKVVKARAGGVSEWSGKSERLNAHHIHGKPTQRLRWELKNGVSLTAGEHKFIAHHTGRQENFKRWAMKLRNFYSDDVLVVATKIGGVDKFGVKMFLENELSFYERKK